VSEFRIEEYIEKESGQTLENARWLAGHVMQFSRRNRKTKVDIEFWAGIIRGSEEFYVHDKCTVGKASPMALEKYRDALEILEGIEDFMNGGK
jgi:hypothetical protein